jgi:hypothetical protein
MIESITKEIKHNFVWGEKRNELKRRHHIDWSPLEKKKQNLLMPPPP